ncbi:MAG: hypothetical protein DRG78_10260 [Epsilonproteobacteria bacterium]|nr:MAG: hypothetical protein DRG78_10260 [Campylobacterota bacterium]
MKLLPMQGLNTLKSLKEYQPLSTSKVSILNIPSEPALILLATQLHNKAEKILNNEIECKKGLCVDSYIHKAISIIKILDDYSDKFISHQELKSIKKEFIV